MATILIWPHLPIVTLISEFCSWDTQWDSLNSAQFTGGIDNILKFQVACKYQKPYGGSARYHVYIDTLIGNSWFNVIRDEFGYYPDPTDTQWHTEFREYQLRQPGSFYADRVLSFRITTQIEGAGYLPTGNQPGSLGNFSNPESHDFKATFTKVKLVTVKEHFDLIAKHLNEVLDHYSTHEPV
jgi:hypothetical protein